MLWRGMPLVAEGRHQRHAAINGIVKQGLMSAHIPSRLDTTGLMRSDGKRPDGVTLAPSKSGCLLVWDATSLDTLAASYRVHSTYQCAGEGYCSSGGEEEQKISGSRVPPGHQFAPIATGPRITSLPGVGMQDQTGDRRTQINGVPGSASVA